MFSFDTRFRWIKTADLPKYISGELQKYRAGEKEEEQKSEASASEKDDQTVHNLPLRRIARSVVEDVFNTALSHVYQEFKQVSQPFVDHVLLQSVKNAKAGYECSVYCHAKRNSTIEKLVHFCPTITHL